MDIQIIKTSGTQKQLKESKYFSFFISVMLILVVILKYNTYTKQALIFLSLLGSAFFAISLYKPHWLIPFIRLWIKFGLIINKITQPFIMAVIFFALFIPIGILLKIIKKDLLEMKFLPKANTYWHNRQNNNSSTDMRYQF